MDEKYCVLVWDKEDTLCGNYVYDSIGTKIFVGNKKEAKEHKNRLKVFHPDATYKIAYYPIRKAD